MPGLRIVSLAPSATSILCGIGARSLLAGVTKWCADVAPVGRLPRVGDCWAGDVSEVLALRPDLVIGSVPYKPDMVTKLVEQPFRFLAMNPRTLADIEADIRLLGGLTGRRRNAQRLVLGMRHGFAAIQAKTRHARKRPRVYCEAWPQPRISSPPWVGELVHIAGGEMVLPAGSRVSDEQVAQALPEVIVLAWAASGEKAKPETAKGVAAWRDVPAIRDNEVHVVRDEWLNTPGPPLVRGAKELFRILRAYEARRGGR
ncbi:MAG TPA: ABC transporter substrate-binding protein [Methylomirabilota bacterium]|nr:ABC transporter substrate-binding protein [Methylomirabilota bacterium]